MMFFLTLKKASHLVSSTFFPSSVVMLVEVRIFSVSSPVQYIRVQTCFSSPFELRQDARQYCPNWRSHLSHLFGFLKSNEEGGCS